MARLTRTIFRGIALTVGLLFALAARGQDAPAPASPPLPAESPLPAEVPAPEAPAAPAAEASVEVVPPAADAAAPIYPPLSTELSAEHPLFLFRVELPADAATSAYAQFVIDAWLQLPDAFKPFSALTVSIPRPDETPALLQPLQDAGIPVVLRVAAGGPGGRQDLAALESVISAYPTLRGIDVRGMRLDIYDGPDDNGDLARANSAWLVGALELAAKYGRFVYWPLTGLDAARFMAHPGYQPARAKLAELRGYVLAVSLQRGEHIAQGNAACLGMWLGNLAGAWGIAADTRWFSDCRLLGPGQIGKGEAKAPPTLYRAMVLNAAMGGAWVFGFDVSGDLWFNDPSPVWNDAIAPVLGELTDLGLAARREFVLKATPLAMQLVEAGTPAAFHRNLHDLSPFIDAGTLWRAALGVNTGPLPGADHLPVLPMLPVGAGAEATGQFKTLVQADEAATLEQRQALVDAAAVPPAGQGAAFIAQVGRGLYVFNTDLRGQTPQDYAIAEVPAAVRGLEARREGDGVTLTWPFREGDVSYNVYKRVSPQLKFTAIARGTEERRFSDPAVPTDQTISYAVTALTNDKEPLSGTVNFGDYLVFSVVESRIAEEALLTPVLTVAEARPFAGFNVPPLSVPGPREGLTEAQAAIANVIEERLGAWRAALEAEDLTATLGLYADEYEDPQGWRLQYVKSTYQSFFDRCAFPRFAFQVRRWDFSAFDTTGQVNVAVYCSLRGNVVSDATGRNADVSVEMPRSANNEVLLSFTGSGGTWRIQRSEPSLPNLDDLLAGLASPAGAGN